MISSNLQFSWQWLKVCPFCDQAREVLKTELLQETADGSWFYFQCPQCLVGLVFLLDQKNGLPRFFGWPTDLTYSELMTNLEQGQSALGADELLTMHEIFAKNNQVNSLFK